MVESNITANEANKFSVSLLAFWVKGSMSVNDRFLNIDMPNTVFFGLIPAGKEKEKTPLSGITNVTTSSSFKMGSMIFGAIIALGGFAAMGQDGLGGLIIALIGILMVLSGIKTSFSFERSGIRQQIDVPFFESSKVGSFVDEVNSKIANYQDDRNVRMQTDRQINNSNNNTATIVNAINGQNSTVSSNSDQGSFCPSCGALNTTDAKFCTHCGTKLQ